MTNQLSLFEQLAYSTVKIVTTDAKGKKSSGTGFFFSYSIDNEKGRVLLITNKHVINGASKGNFKFTLADADGNPSNDHYSINAEDDFEKNWIMHPEKDVDLCAFNLSDIYSSLLRQGIQMFITGFNESNIPSESVLSELDALEEVYTIGYPSGLMDTLNNKPIFRRGITATNIRTNYEGTPNFLIDSAIYQGSSGSPVVIANSGGYSNKYGHFVIGNRVWLIGIVHSVFNHTINGNIIQAPISNLGFGVNIQMPNNLGVVVKSQKLLDFIHF